MSRHDLPPQAKTNAGGHRKKLEKFLPFFFSTCASASPRHHQWPESVFPSVGIHATIHEVECNRQITLSQ